MREDKTTHDRPLVKTIHTPLSQETLCSLRAGDIVELSGEVITARDAAHKRIETELAHHTKLPLDFYGRVIFYAGPCPAKPGYIIGSIAPTTSIRMDGFLEMCYGLGVSATIGKGGRSDRAAILCKQYKRVYFLGFGGVAALMARQVKKCTVLAYEDLDSESIKALLMEKIRLVVGIDSEGRVFETEQIEKYKR